MPLHSSPVASDDDTPHLCEESVFGWPELNAAAGSLNLVKSLASALTPSGLSTPRERPQTPSRALKMASFLFGSAPSPSSPSLSSLSTGTSDDSDLSLATLPDELLSMCYSSLTAHDLVALELVSRRLRDLVAADDIAWKECARKTWAEHQNFDLMSMGATTAGSWKQLYAAKKLVEASSSPWTVPCSHEVQAMFELIKGSAPKSTIKSRGVQDLIDMDTMSGSPRSIMGASSAADAALSIVLLVDGSSSVTEDDFSAQRNFCLQLVNSVRQTHSNANVAILQFNQYPKVHSGLTNVGKLSLVNAIQTMQQMMGSTDIAAPIRRARQMLAEEGGAGGEKAIVILTDGQTHSDELREAEREARQAAVDSGARLFALGVGRDVDEAGLRRVACGTSESLGPSNRLPMANGHYFPLRKMHRG